MTTATLALALVTLGHPDRTSADRASAHILASTVLRAATAHDVPPILLAAIAAHETNFHREHVGAAGERGRWQMLPATARLLGYRGSDTALAQDPLNAGYAAAWLAHVRAVCARHGHTSEAAFVNAYRGASCRRKPGGAWPTRYARQILDLAAMARAATQPETKPNTPPTIAERHPASTAERTETRR